MAIHPEDNEIIDLFNQGGIKAEKAFSSLVAKYGESLYRQIRHITKNHELTNDVLQNVFIKVFQNLSNFKKESALYTWLYRITRNETLNYLDKEKRRSGIDIDGPLLEIIAGHDVLDNTTPEVITQLLDDAIDSLPEKQSLVFQLKYFEELKYSEISARLNTSEGALKANYHHARQKIETFIINKLNH